MFYSMGNLMGNGQVGLLFIDFERPHRVRLQGIASVDDGDPLLQNYAEAQLVVRVAVSEIFRNCPRYVHPYTKSRPSEYVPRATCKTPLAPWKRVDDIRASLPANRFARDLIVQETGWKRLQADGITLIAADSPDQFVDDTPTAVLIRQILGAVAQFDKAMTVAKRRGARERKRRKTGAKVEGRKSWVERSAEDSDEGRSLQQ
jgi:hypothetical protein